MDSLLDQAVEMAVARITTMCEDEEKMNAIYASILTPFTKYLTEKFSWFLRMVQSFMVLIVLQTILILFLVYSVRQSPFPRVPLQ